MPRTVEAVIGIKHGETCTCTPLDPVTVSVQPVIVAADCPKQRQVPRASEPVGRIAITWPASRDGGAMLVRDIALRDYDTGTGLTDALGMRLIIGGNAWEGLITAELLQLVGDDDKPLGSRPVIPAEDGKSVRTAVFRYFVVEMRIAEEA